MMMNYTAGWLREVRWISKFVPIRAAKSILDAAAAADCW